MKKTFLFIVIPNVYNRTHTLLSLPLLRNHKMQFNTKSSTHHKYKQFYPKKFHKRDSLFKFPAEQVKIKMLE